MRSPEGAPAWLDAFTAEERPDLWQRARTERTFEPLWPEYNQHGTHAAEYFGALVPRFAHLQALFVDHRSGDLVARARTIPFGRSSSIPSQWNGMVRARATRSPVR